LPQLHSQFLSEPSTQPRLRLSRYALASEVFYEPGRITPLRILYSTRSGARLALKDETWSALKADPSAEVDRALREALVKFRFLVPDTEDELTDVLAENRQVQTTTRTLAYALQPTAACQLGCDYCGQAHSPKTLSEENLKAILERIEQKLIRGNFQALNVAWYGGEPLLAQHIMRRASGRFRDLTERLHVEYSARLVTNGVRLDKQAQAELHEVHRITYVEVTLDGDEATHDARRRWKRTARGSFATILGNVSTLLARPPPRPEVGIRCNVDARNVEAVLPLIRTLADAGLHRALRRFYVAPVHSWGNDASTLALPLVEFASKQIIWFAEMARLGFPLELIPHRAYASCMVFKPHAELVDAFGTRFNCSEVSYVPSYTIAGKNIYALSEVGLPGRAAELVVFYERVADGVYPCRQCPMLPVCAGACPKAWLEGETPCPPAKYNIGQRLILEHVLDKRQVSSIELEREHVEVEKELKSTPAVGAAR
jgi:uncharacterized protein